ncbi:hypothetical protein PAN31108_02797 [Pandoraea anhela]|uniref:Uncharacterized protein n=1 Tax=Pandoraea anhela TaxID=2508295 RepID=A0A5E4VTA7_9BURK|nr:hypothetical protein PAN31108_02797 [Pandoraea anhela]
MLGKLLSLAWRTFEAAGQDDFVIAHPMSAEVAARCDFVQKRQQIAPVRRRDRQAQLHRGRRSILRQPVLDFSGKRHDVAGVERAVVGVKSRLMLFGKQNVGGIPVGLRQRANRLIDDLPDDFLRFFCACDGGRDGRGVHVHAVVRRGNPRQMRTGGGWDGHKAVQWRGRRVELAQLPNQMTPAPIADGGRGLGAGSRALSGGGRPKVARQRLSQGARLGRRGRGTGARRGAGRHAERAGDGARRFPVLSRGCAGRDRIREVARAVRVAGGSGGNFGHWASEGTMIVCKEAECPLSSNARTFAWRDNAKICFDRRSAQVGSRVAGSLTNAYHRPAVPCRLARPHKKTPLTSAGFKQCPVGQHKAGHSGGSLLRQWAPAAASAPLPPPRIGRVIHTIAIISTNNTAEIQKMSFAPSMADCCVTNRSM